MSSKRDRENSVKSLQPKLRALPDTPGVYLHKDKKGKVIYVGKAKRLSQRVRSYFQSDEHMVSKTKQLVRRIDDFDFIVTDGETDALVLENQLIKEYRPRYNVRLKDDKQYPYLRISLGEAFPRITVVRRIAADHARYFGPYTDARAMRETLKFAAGVFQVRTCALDLPEQTIPRPCLDYQIGRCSAPCVGLDTQTAYRRKVRQLVLFLEGANKELIRGLHREMANRSAALEYEIAATIRDRIGKLEKTITRGRTIAGLRGNLDVSNLARDGRDACGVILRVRRGKILTVHHFHLVDQLASDLSAIQDQLLREYYPRAGDIPAEILVAQPVNDPELWTAWLSQLRGKKVRLHRPQRGIKNTAVEIAGANAAVRLGERRTREITTQYRKVTPADVQLQQQLDLQTLPATIECFDISNFQGRETVGSLVFFKGGKPLKSRYRRFRVRTVSGPDDFASMREVLERYYRRLADRQERPADLVVVDGGAGQLGVARAVLTQYGFHQVELLGLAKKEETIHREDRTLNLPRGCEALRLLQRVRDEAHRFAITYHRLLRDQKTTASALDLIPGIGRIKKLSLLHHFGSLAAIRAADAEQLGQVRGINRHDVASILAFFAGETQPDPPKER